MKTLIMMRHAKSSWKDPNLTDHQRPLNKRGKKDAPRMGELLRKQALLPELILCSTAERARMTAKLFIKSSGFNGEIRFLNDLYSADTKSYLKILSTLEDDFNRIMVIGHNPELEDLQEMITGKWHRLTTAAIAVLELPIERWEDMNTKVRGTLTHLWRPKEIS